MPEPGKHDKQERAEEALERLEERVQDVRHLHPFKLSRREDGRFTCELDRPLSEVTDEEARVAAQALEELAALIRSTISK